MYDEIGFWYDKTDIKTDMNKTIRYILCVGFVLFLGLTVLPGANAQQEILDLRPRFVPRSEWGVGILPEQKIQQVSASGRFYDNDKTLHLEYDPSITDGAKDEEAALHLENIGVERYPSRITVHHTATPQDKIELLTSTEIVRGIYQYHVYGRGWDDIGYHYLIDQEGNIFEGVNPVDAGAHVAWRNSNNLGVALIGNFEIVEPTKEQLDVLALLLAHHSQLFNIDPLGESLYFDEDVHNIAGHRDVADHDYGTSCPGKNLHVLLPQIRETTYRLIETLRLDEVRKPSGLDFLRNSVDAGKFQQKRTLPRRKEEIVLARLIPKLTTQRGKKGSIEMVFENNTEFTWKAGSPMTVGNIPDGMIVTRFKAMQDIAPKERGIFRAKYLVRTTPNGLYEMSVYPAFLKGKVAIDEKNHVFDFPVQVSGSMDTLRNPTGATKVFDLGNIVIGEGKFTFGQTPSLPRNSEKEVKIKLSYFDATYLNIVGDSPVHVFGENEKFLFSVGTDERIKVLQRTEEGRRFLRLQANNKEYDTNNVSVITEGVLTIENYDRGLGNVNAYNEFRRRLNIYPDRKVQDGLLVVNQLPLEEYLWGLAEQPVTEPEEKKKAIEILARSYAYVYTGKRRKFDTQLYDLEDSPATSQLYLGYGWEKLRPEQKERIQSHRGTMMTYDGVPVIGPYFTQSNGQSSSKWASAYPWAQGRPLPHDRGLESRGHGVGLSGNSARKLAEEGMNMEEILDYFFVGVEVEKIYE